MPSLLLLFLVILLLTSAATFVYGMHFDRKATVQRYSDFEHPAHAERLYRIARILRAAAWISLFLVAVMIVLLIT